MVTTSPYITDTRSFGGVIEEDPNGIRKMRLLSPDFYTTELKKFKLGEKVSVMISSRKPKRSEAQNRLYWGLYLPLIAKETGEKDLEALHNLFKGRFLTTEIKLVLGQQVRMIKSTTELSKNDFSEYITSIEELTGILCPSTEGYWD